ncbi:hypothetical protein DHD05_00335 [Arenibacter sp. N53]|uniref:hypothetical protein n=1 Tax=Arenibacter TaxID=178469 RepID=UPI000CD47F61|nr:MULTISPECIES: hypothetical protein [Arenibacter]MCM4150025.1 hypothetical protein [Arenibacter sp. N53]
MDKITVKKLIDFRNKSERSKKTFANNLKQDKKSENASGGDYWISSLSTISNIFKTNNTDLFADKIELLYNKIENSEDKRTKLMFQRNIDILYSFEDFDFHNIKPNLDLEFLKKPESKSIIDIQGFPIHVKPNHVFTFHNNGNYEIGAIWFIAKLQGYKRVELGMFADVLYRYLTKNYSKDYSVNLSYCCAVDVSNGHDVNYTNIQKGEIPILIDQTIEDIKTTK